MVRILIQFTQYSVSFSPKPPFEQGTSLQLSDVIWKGTVLAQLFFKMGGE